MLILENPPVNGGFSRFIRIALWTSKLFFLILPGALIAACGLESEVDMRIQGRTIIIEAAGKPRAHWFDSVVVENEEADEWDAIPPDEGTEEWVW
jgi:hypothetical protein